jgi:hypothetical protein
MRRWPPQGFPLLALAGVVGSAIALLLDAHDTLAAWLAAAVAVSAVPLGALMVLMMTCLVPGRWTRQMHVPLTAAALCIPVTALLFLPVLIGMPWLYPWVQAPPTHAFQAAYLSSAFFVLRTIAYFVIWTALAFWVRAAWGAPAAMTRAASAGLIVWALTVSFAGVDWSESLNPEFHSSIYGLLFLTFLVLAGLAYAIAVTAIAHPQTRAVSGYGALLLSVLLLWAYMHAMQYIIIWSGNIPREVTWYLRRETGVWMFVLWGLILLQFVVPFFALLSGRVRNRAQPLLVIAGATLALRAVEAWLLVLPSAEADGAVVWLAVPATLAAAVGILGWSLRFTLARLERSAADTRALPAAESA